MKQLSGQDNSFLEIEGIGIPQHISSVAIYDQSTAPDGTVRFKDILSHLKSRLHLSPIKDSLEGATINDVMLTIVTGALHKYLKAEGELPLESLTCGCPIDIRDKSDKDTEGNLIGFMGVNLSTQIEDPMERFKAVHEAAVRAKARKPRGTKAA
jgi:hypothetical protein